MKDEDAGGDFQGYSPVGIDIGQALRHFTPRHAAAIPLH